MGQFQVFPLEASTEAGKVDMLFLGLSLIFVFFAVLIFSTIIAFLIIYREGSSADRTDRLTPLQKHLIEVTWTVIPTVIGLALFAWGARVYYEQKRPPDNALQIHVLARQWMWKFQHPNGAREIDQLHVPVNKAVHLSMISEDVIHSLFVPDFRMKQDVLPGRVTDTWFCAIRIGEYNLFCTQYCGFDHSQMVGRVVVMPPAAYDAWAESRANVPSSGASPIPGQLLTPLASPPGTPSSATPAQPDVQPGNDSTPPAPRPQESGPPPTPAQP